MDRRGHRGPMGSLVVLAPLAAAIALSCAPSGETGGLESSQELPGSPGLPGSGVESNHRDVANADRAAPHSATRSSFALFESGQVRPLAISPDRHHLFAVNTPDNRLEIF